VARSGRYAIRIDATRRGGYPWLITLEGRSVRKGVAPDRDQAADAVSDALDELPARDVIPRRSRTAPLLVKPLLTCMLRLEAFAVVCRRSSASDGLVTA
jgi:hypothetical protein